MICFFECVRKAWTCRGCCHDFSFPEARGNPIRTRPDQPKESSGKDRRGTRIKRAAGIGRIDNRARPDFYHLRRSGRRKYQRGRDLSLGHVTLREAEITFLGHIFPAVIVAACAVIFFGQKGGNIILRRYLYGFDAAVLGADLNHTAATGNKRAGRRDLRRHKGDNQHQGNKCPARENHLFSITQRKHFVHV